MGPLVPAESPAVGSCSQGPTVFATSKTLQRPTRVPSWQVLASPLPTRPFDLTVPLRVREPCLTTSKRIPQIQSQGKSDTMSIRGQEGTPGITVLAEMTGLFPPHRHCLLIWYFSVTLVHALSRTQGPLCPQDLRPILTQEGVGRSQPLVKIFALSPTETEGRIGCVLGHSGTPTVCSSLGREAPLAPIPGKRFRRSDPLSEPL